MQNSWRENKTLYGWLAFLGRPVILFYALPWLMVLLILGTVAQRDMGLFEAQRIFFSSWILWAGPFPLPGTYATLGVITICLFIKFILFSPWRIQQAGIILSHLGVLILLIGGLVTSFSQREGFIAIGEDRTENSVSDYHERVLTVSKDDGDFITLPFERLNRGGTIENLPFKATIQSTCENCRPAPVRDPNGRKGLAEQIMLRDAPLEKEAESNLSGVTFRIEDADGFDGDYVLMEEIPHTPEIKMDKSMYRFEIGRAQTRLPFDITLKDFRRDLHPGTDMAKAFASDILITDGETQWPYTISMNEPLRYKGYTLYQASFSVRPDGEYSVLSVVQNKGRIFPYIASILIFGGLLLHVVLRSRRYS